MSQIYIKRPKKVGLKVFMLILCSITYSALILSDDYRSEANILLNINERPGAKTLYEKSLLLNPFNFTAMLGKASALHEGINSKKGLELIERSLKIFPEYEAALFNKSIINYKNGHLLTAFYYAGVAFKKNRMNKQYREWYEFVKKNLPSRNTIKRD